VGYTQAKIYLTMGGIKSLVIFFLNLKSISKRLKTNNINLWGVSKTLVKTRAPNLRSGGSFDGDGGFCHVYLVLFFLKVFILDPKRK